MSITVAQPEVTTAVAKTSSSNYQITISNVPDTITSITVPVWSEKNGQDDLVWYTASQVSEGTYTVNVSVTDHSSDTGHYNVHVYGHSSITGGLIGLAATSGFDNIDDRANATVSVVNYAESKSTFDVIVAGSSSTKDISSVAIAVWSEDKGQDDLKWYTPTVSNNTATATINIADLSNTTDNYIVHVYTTYSDGTTVGTDLGTYRITTKHEVTAALTSTGISLSLDSNTVSDYSKVKFAVWSSENGQDDLVWYDASPTGTALAAYTNHSGYGTYYIHTYSYESGRAIGLNATTITIAAPSVTTAVTRTSDTTYTITVSNVPLYIDSVLVPTWTDTNGQDDIVWTATTQSDSTTYTATISLRDHSYELGTYVAHVYGRSQLSNNQLVGLGITNFTVDSIDTAIENPTITVTSYDADAGTLTLKISETNNSKKISSANVAAWSESDQSNLYWYTETATDGTVIVTINAKNHNYSQGDYTVHAYVTFIDSTTTGYVVGTYTFNAEKPISSTGYFVDISSHNGAISVAEFTALKNQGITGVVVKLTEGTSYTNPYAASQIANAQAAGLKVSAYHYSHYTTTGEAVAEAQYFVSVARSLGLSTSAVMVNDMEESTMLSADINANTQAWKNEMNRLGYTNLVYYTMASWLDIRGGRVSTSQFGFENFWIAHYVNGYTYLSQESALSLSYYSSAAAWQYTSVSTKLSSSYLDENIDYTGRFTS